MNPRRFALSAALVAVVAVPVLLPQAALASTRSSAVACPSTAGASTATTASYRFILRAGMPEKMYTPAQVKAMHPKTGEMMVAGTMMSAMAMGTTGVMRHLEVQICSLATGELITDAKPTITMSGGMGVMARPVPFAMMRGVKAGMSDMHYGNNVKMQLGQKMTFKVTLNGETAVLTVQMPMHS